MYSVSDIWSSHIKTRAKVQTRKKPSKVKYKTVNNELTQLDFPVETRGVRGERVLERLKCLRNEFLKKEWRFGFESENLGERW